MKCFNRSKFWMQNDIQNLLFTFSFRLFPDNLSVSSDREVESVHQDVRTIEIIYQGRWDRRRQASVGSPRRTIQHCIEGKGRVSNQIRPSFCSKYS